MADVPPASNLKFSDTVRKSANQRVLVAIGHFGREVLREQRALLAFYDRRILIARATSKRMPQHADVVLHYGKHYGEAWDDLHQLLEDSSAVGVVAAAGAVAGSMLTLRVVREMEMTGRKISVAMGTPFSWEGRKRHWRALYVMLRLRRMKCELSVIHTSKIEGAALQAEPFDQTVRRITWLAASALVNGRPGAAANEAPPD